MTNDPAERERKNDKARTPKTMLSIILSKAFVLADDENITDTSILSQIRRK